MSAEDFVLMSSYLPLVREFIPNASADIESDIRNYVSKQGLGLYFTSFKNLFSLFLISEMPFISFIVFL